jgi:hypothetical protein
MRYRGHLARACCTPKALPRDETGRPTGEPPHAPGKLNLNQHGSPFRRGCSPQGGPYQAWHGGTLGEAMTQT